MGFFGHFAMTGVEIRQRPTTINAAIVIQANFFIKNLLFLLLCYKFKEKQALKPKNAVKLEG